MLARNPAPDAAFWMRRFDAVAPRVDLLGGRTPLVHLPRISRAVGRDVLLKRDDFGDFGLAGAKARKLERIIAQARADGARGLITIGPPQSNTCRAVASVCAAAGLEAHLVLASDEPVALTGNVLCASLFGARLYWAGPRDYDALSRRLDELWQSLHTPERPLVKIEGGCSSLAGVIGMASAYVELLDQLTALGMEAGCIVHASATGGLYAGLKVGQLLLDGPAPRPVMAVPDLFDSCERRYAGLVNQALAAVSSPMRITAGDVSIDRSLVGSREAADRVASAIRRLASTEGVLCEPTYSGKALAAVLRGDRLPDGPVVLWHSGGMPSLGAPEIIEQLNVT